jgi:hypothetical protein
MSHRALYYPNVTIDDPDFLFESLLYWDSLASLVPFEKFRPFRHVDTELEREISALEEAHLVGICPSPAQKQAVHTRVARLLERPAPPWYRPGALLADDQYSVLWVQKLSPKTIELLEESNWLLIDQRDDRGLISRAVANIILGLLAEECSSPTLPAITNDSGAFRTSCNTLLMELKATSGLSGGVSGASQTQDPFPESSGPTFVLAAIKRLCMAPGSVGPTELRRLGDIRRDGSFDAQREAFCNRVDRYIEELRKAPAGEHAMIARSWEDGLKRDRDALRRELRAAGIEGVFDKDGAVGLIGAGGLAAAGAVVAGIGVGGPIGAVIGLGVTVGRGWFATRRRRRDVLDRHWTSWLYSVDRKLSSA